MQLVSLEVVHARTLLKIAGAGYTLLQQNLAITQVSGRTYSLLSVFYNHDS